MIWVVPGVTKPGTICNRPVELMGMYPTLCELAGIPVPKHVEAVSFKPLLENPNAEWNKPALCTFGFQNHTVRSEQWRYIRYANGDEELYDHRNDPYEWTNLASRAEFKSVKQDLAQYFPKKNLPEGTKRGKGNGRRQNKNQQNSKEKKDAAK
jgi:arylsulfatase A-like enzyme